MVAFSENKNNYFWFVVFLSFDVFATFRVKSFRFLAKMENIQYYWDKRVFYQTAFYPQFKPSFRMGIAWLFRD